jgi:hypothetical protein
LEIEDDGDLDTTIYTEVPEDVSDDSDYELQKTIAAATLGRQTGIFYVNSLHCVDEKQKRN